MSVLRTEQMAREINSIVDPYFSLIAQLVRALARKAKGPGSSLGPGQNFSLSIPHPIVGLLLKTKFSMFNCLLYYLIRRQALRRLQAFQNKILRIAVNAPRFIRNKKFHCELGLLTINGFIQIQARNFFNNLQKVPGAVFYSLGQKSFQKKQE